MIKKEGDSNDLLTLASYNATHRRRLSNQAWRAFHFGLRKFFSCGVYVFPAIQRGERRGKPMKTTMELINERTALWEQTKALLDRSRDPVTGMVPADEVAKFERMTAQIKQIGNEINLREKQAEMDRLIYGDKAPASPAPSSAPTVTSSGKGGNAIASESYTNAFSNMLRGLGNITEVRDALSVGVDREGGYTVPETFSKKLVEKLNDHNVIRRMANVIQTVNGEHKIPIAAANAEADWIDEAAPVPETTLEFDKISFGAYKLGALLKATNEFLKDTAIDVEDYVADQLALALGNKEEVAFINGTGVKQPTGLLHDTDGAGIGATTANSGIVTFDDVMRLYYSLGAPYRKDAAFLCNEDLLLKLMMLKDGSGQYLWKPSLELGKPDTLLGKPIVTSAYMPELTAGKKVLLFGDFDYYWIADRGKRTLRRLNELFAMNEYVGFLMTQRVDGKLILKDAMKALKVKE